MKDINRLIIDARNGQIRVALVRNDDLDHFFIERETTNAHNYGSIYMGRIEEIKPGIQAAFINIGVGKNGILHANDLYFNSDNLPIEKCLKKGQELVVQINKEAFADKGPKLTTKVSLSGYYLVLLPMEQGVYFSKKIGDKKEKQRLKAIVQQLNTRGFGLIVRTEAEGAEVEGLKKELDYLLTRWNKVNPVEIAPKRLLKDVSIVERMLRDYYNGEIDEILVNDKDVFDEIQDYFRVYFPNELKKINFIDKLDLISYSGMETKVSKLFERKVWLRSGGYIVIDYTEACTVIDVNSGKFTGYHDKEKTFLKINLEATEEIANQIRLRNIGGIIIIDYINVKRKEEQKSINDYLKRCLQKDKSITKVYGFTDLCILQMTRQQQGKRLSTIQMEECPLCNGRGLIENQEVLFYRAISIIERNQNLLQQEAITVNVDPHLKELLLAKVENHEENFVQRVEEHYNIRIQIESNPYLKFGEIIFTSNL